MKQDGTPPTASETDGERFRHLFENIQDAVVEFEFEDGEPIIRTVNDAFRALFGLEGEEIVGTSLNDHIVPNDQRAQSDRFDRRTAAGKSNDAIVDRRTEEGVQTLLYRGIPHRNGQRGFAVYTDLTDEIRQERELAVLNRVLRYNLSSEVGQLTDHAERLIEGVDDPELAASAESVRESALALERMSKEARDVERALDADPELKATSLDEVVTDALKDVQLVAHADVSVDLADTPDVMTGGHLDRAVAALVDNAIRYADVPTPNVWVTSTGLGDRVALRVRDEGPGLPEQERRLLTGEMRPTPLDHGSGLGLWLVRWIVTAYDGTVSYEETEVGGEITLELLPAR